MYGRFNILQGGFSLKDKCYVASCMKEKVVTQRSLVNGCLEMFPFEQLSHQRILWEIKINRTAYTVERSVYIIYTNVI